MCGVSGAGSPAAPLGLCAGGESAGAGPSTVSCPRRASGGGPSFRGGWYVGGEFARRPISCLSCARRALGETHRSAVSVCRRGARPASDCPRVEPWGRPIVPRCRYAGEDFARRPTVPASSFEGDPSFRGVGMPARSSPGVRLSPRRALRETHRSAVSVCRRGVSPGVRLSMDVEEVLGETHRFLRVPRYASENFARRPTVDGREEVLREDS